MTTKTEAKKARAWREAQGYTREELAALTGYSPVAIYWFEVGETPPGRGSVVGGKIKSWVWQRYKMACAGVTLKAFDWE